MNVRLCTLATLALAGAVFGAARARALSPAEQAQQMNAAHQHDAPVPTAATEAAPRVAVDGKDVVYATLAGKDVHGYVARPKDAKGPLPGIIVIQEWWGLNDNMRAVTRRLAGEGYEALAVDLYGGQVAADPDAATKLMQGVLQNTDAAVENLKAAYAYLHQDKAPKIGVIGWCFGGGWSLQTALALPDRIDATVMYYGRVVTDATKLAPLKMPILALFGGADESIPASDVQAFQDALHTAGKTATIKVYPGAKHAFANPSGKSYDAAAAADAWKLTVDFFAKHLKG
jgi:carboxymethylenebutenolidase